MDTKAMAKSKRAHTQHHTKKPHKPKAPEKLQGNQTKTPVQSRLPSNWDRYDDELNPGLENASEDMLPTSSQPADAIVPKSKGADYLHLISEAQAESHSKIDINSDSLDDLLHDEFSRVVGSMISARGEGKLSWMEDDNFVVVEEEKSASHHEPGFLSLDLNALEKMLEKVDVHERLYIDADLLPPELCTAQSKVSRGKEPCRSHTSQDVEAMTTRLNELVVQQESSAKINSIVSQDISSVMEAESLDPIKDIPILTSQSEKSSAIETDLDLLSTPLVKRLTHWLVPPVRSLLYKDLQLLKLSWILFSTLMVVQSQLNHLIKRLTRRVLVTCLMICWRVLHHQPKHRGSWPLQLENPKF